MHIETLDPADDTRVAEVLALWREAQTVDRPRDPAFTPTSERGRIVHPLPDEPTTYHLAYDGGRLVGVADLELPNLDNTGTGWMQLHVRPEARRRGTGDALWAHVAQRCRAADRKLVVFEAAMDSPGEVFARRHGAELGILSARRRLVVDDGARALAGALAAGAHEHAVGYELHSFRGATPARWLGGLAYLQGRMSIDAPLDDLEWEPEHYDADRQRGREALFEAHGIRAHTTLAVQARTGAVAGFSTIGLCVDDLTAGHQWNTIVDPDHRGHRLGILVKAANLRFTLAHEPAMATVLTWNAVSNAHMIAVNEAMGFRLWDHWGEWQIRL